MLKNVAYGVGQTNSSVSISKFETQKPEVIKIVCQIIFIEKKLVTLRNQKRLEHLY